MNAIIPRMNLKKDHDWKLLKAAAVGMLSLIHISEPTRPY